MTRLFVLFGFLLVPGAVPAEAGPPADAVTVLYRGRTHTLSGEHATAARTAGLAMLGSSCDERDTSNDIEMHERYLRALKRSHVRITFAKAEMVPNAGNNKVPVQVNSLVVPFSPDLDPETVYVLPGKPFRAFSEFMPENCDLMRTALIKAGVYPPDPPPQNLRPDGKALTRLR
jgi:hypothetical protein